jgi:hypothetical protein
LKESNAEYYQRSRKRYQSLQTTYKFQVEAERQLNLKLEASNKALQEELAVLKKVAAENKKVIDELKELLEQNIVN